ncbi:MAG: hypothetical protein ACRC7N_21275 [Clostridium sp.]
MNINDKYKIEGLDPLNAVVLEKYKTKATEERLAEEKWKIISYHPNIEAAFKSLVDRVINESGIKNLHSLIKAIEELKDFKRDEWYISEDNIKLKPIDFDKSEFQITLQQELNKCKEEDDEFYKAIINNDIPNALEEFHDTIQSKLQVLDMINVPVGAITSSQKEHFEKLKSRGWEFK